MTRVGFDAQTGKLLTGWDHVVQSLGKCLRLRVGSRPFRRHHGSYVPLIQDENANTETIFRLYVSIAKAVNDPDCGEPGFNLRTIELARGGRDGRFVFILAGDYFPRGHLGDFSIRQAAAATIPLEVLS